MTSRAPNFHCFRPRPITADLPPEQSAIVVVLSAARGIFIRGGMSVRVIATQTGMREADVAQALRMLKGLDVVEQPANSPERWRMRR